MILICQLFHLNDHLIFLFYCLFHHHHNVHIMTLIFLSFHLHLHLQFHYLNSHSHFHFHFYFRFHHIHFHFHFYLLDFLILMFGQLKLHLINRQINSIILYVQGCAFYILLFLRFLFRLMYLNLFKQTFH